MAITCKRIGNKIICKGFEIIGNAPKDKPSKPKPKPGPNPQKPAKPKASKGQNRVY